MDPLLSFFSTLRLDQVSLAVIGLLAVVALLTGRLVPRAVVEDRMKDKDRQIAILTEDRDRWHDAHDVSEKGREVLKEQNGDLIRALEPSTRFMESGRKILERSIEQGEA